MASQKRFTAYAWIVLTFSIAVLLWGAAVRATWSGAGCGDRWPLCNGGWMPRCPQLQTVIEFTHRITSGPTLGLMVLALVVFAFRAFPPRHAVRQFAAAAALFTVTEALIGALLVLLGHVGTNTSPYRALTLAIHLVNTLVLLAVLALTAWFAGASAKGRTPSGEGHPAPRILPVCAMLAFLTVSLTGVIAALSDTLFTAGSLAQGIRQDLSPTSHIFVRLRVWHPAVAALLGCLIVGFAIRAVTWKAPTPIVRRLAIAVDFLTLAQVAVGATNVLLLAPVWIQLTHLFFADLLWLGLVLLCAETTGIRTSGVVQT